MNVPHDKMKSTDGYEERYGRQTMLPQVGLEGQRKLSKSRILVIGAGGLGSPVALYLAAAGIGLIGIVDDDNVDLSNLQRQVLHNTGDIGTPKAASAKEKISLLNPGIKVIAHHARFNADTASRILGDGYDAVIDCTDNPASKFLVNDICVEAGIPLVHGAINQFSGNVMTIVSDSATLRDLFGTPPPTSSQPIGTFGAIAGIIGSIQAAEAIKLQLGIGNLLVNRVLTFDALSMTCSVFRIPPQAHKVAAE